MFFPVAVSRMFTRLDDGIRRRGVWSRYCFLQGSARWPRHRLEALQSEKLRALAVHAAGHSPYYRDLFAAAGIRPESIRSLADLAALPLLSRETVRERGEEIRSRGVSRNDLLENSTGGSTGSNVRFWVDRDCWRWRDAASLRMWEMMGLRAGTPTVMIWGSPMDRKWASTVRTRIRLALDNRKFLSAYRIGEREIEQIVRYIARVRPRVLHGYPSVLDRIATHVRQRGLAWPDLPGLTIVSASESLFPEQRRNIAATLKGRVVNLYGCREFGLIAVECASGGLHLQEERLIVELLPSDDGPFHRIVVTDLDNFGFPFLRYDIGDLATEDSSPCPCGRAHGKLASLAGRAFDVIRAPSGEAVGGTFWSLLLRTAVDGVDTWQVVQTGPDVLEIRISPKGALDSAGQATVRTEVHRALGPGMEVRFQETDHLEPLPSGKHRFVVGLPAGRPGS